MYSRYSKLIVFVLCAFLTETQGLNDSEGCSLAVVNVEKFTPLLFHNHTTYFELAIPRQGNINLGAGDGITLACPGKKNYLTATNSSSSYAVCIKEKLLRILRETIPFDDLKCNSRVTSEVRKSEVKCANNKGYIAEIGYHVTKNNWVGLIKICYDNITGVTFYTEHYLYGSELKYSVEGQDRPGFSTEGLESIPANVAYTRIFQKSTLNKLLSSEKLASLYINNNSYLARGHLSPNADFLLTTSRRATFYLINATPQWQVINGGNWKSVEAMVKKAAEEYNRTFTILTGTYGILALHNVNENLTPIYLESKGRLPVPQLIWKIMYDHQAHMGIVFIVVNNPFAKNISQCDLLCENICDRQGWQKDNWSNINRGFVYCCDLKKFLRIVNTAPRLKVKGTLPRTNSL